MSEETLFARAVELPPAERAAFLDRECGDDGALRARLESLLAAHDAPASFWQTPVVSLERTAERPEDLVGTTVAGFAVRRVIGVGGMGAVYEAEQTEPVRRLVALKVLRSELATADTRARFAAERQVLALMDHPGIAKLWDAGTTETGRPFFAMELVNGAPITDYCDAERLSITARVRLVIQVCRAVEHAHQKGVIHRDLKPSNVLAMTRDGAAGAVVIDFGVAKLVGADLRALGTRTGAGFFVGTPEYMSPEQAALDAADVDTRADVYALGGLCYELLTGRRPVVRADGEPLLDTLRRVCEEVPPAPSSCWVGRPTADPTAAARSATPATLRARLRGELDWIVLRALAKERDERYASAGDLAADFERALAGEPVAAGPPTTTYRLRKFAARHKSALSTAMLVAVLLVVATLISVGQAAEARQARDATDAAMRHAMTALRALSNDVVERLLAQQQQLADSDRDFLEKLIGYFDDFAALQGDDVASHRVRAEGKYRVASIRARLGDAASAAALYRDAIAGFDVVRARQPDPEVAGLLARARSNLAVMLHFLGQPEEAFAVCRAAVDDLQDLVDADAAPDDRFILAKTKTVLGMIVGDRGDPEAAFQEHREACEVLATLVAEQPSEGKYREELARGHINLSVGWTVRGELDRALAELEAARAELASLAAAAPEVARHRRELAIVFGKIGSIAQTRGDVTGALAATREQLAIRDRLVHDFPSAPQHQHELSASHRAIAVLLLQNGEVAGSRDAAREAIAVLEPVFAAAPQVTLYRGDLARAHQSLAEAMVAAEDAEAAVGAAEVSVALRRELLQQDRSPRWVEELADGLRVLGLACGTADDRQGARAALGEVVTLLEGLVQPSARAAQLLDQARAGLSGLGEGER